MLFLFCCHLILFVATLTDLLFVEGLVTTSVFCTNLTNEIIILLVGFESVDAIPDSYFVSTKLKILAFEIRSFCGVIF